MPQKKVKRKTCRDCKIDKPISAFYVKEHRRTATRYFSRCKPCYYAWVYEKDKSKGFKWHGPRQKHGPARLKLTTAVYTGKVKKPRHCSSCGKLTPKAKLHGHHHRGYDRPLDVEWLCAKCHHRTHQAVKTIDR